MWANCCQFDKDERWLYTLYMCVYFCVFHSNKFCALEQVCQQLNVKNLMGGKNADTELSMCSRLLTSHRNFSP